MKVRTLQRDKVNIITLGCSKNLVDSEVGIDGILGLDYKFKNIPVNVSIDWQPSVTVVGTAGFTPAYGGLAVRYVF